MMLKQSFELWKSKSDLVKLQYAYAFVVLVTLVTAGLIGLLNQEVSRIVLSVAGIAAMAFFVNLLSFALVNLVSDQSSSRNHVATTRTNKKS